MGIIKKRSKIVFYFSSIIVIQLISAERSHYAFILCYFINMLHTYWWDHELTGYLSICWHWFWRCNWNCRVVPKSWRKSYDEWSAAGGHFNPFGKKHGAPTDEERHVGDLGNIVADGAGIAEFTIEDSVASLVDEEYSILGKAIVLHAGEDDLGRGGDEGSETTGNAGASLGCCIIGQL